MCCLTVVFVCSYFAFALFWSSWRQNGEIQSHQETERERVLSAIQHARECVFTAINARTSSFLAVLVAL